MTRDYDASRKTLVTRRSHAVIDGQQLTIVHQTVTVPGYFVDGLLEVFEVVREMGRSTMPGLGGRVSEVIAWGRTLDEARDKAAAELVSKPRAK